MVTLASFWDLPPLNLELSDQEIHVWCAGLDQPEAVIQQFALLLSEDERSRSQRFRFDQHRQRFIVARGVLRSLLSKYLKVAPAEIQFCYGQHGKPALSQAFAHYSLYFNLSHSQELGLYAFAHHTPLGVDVEYCSPCVDIDSIVNRYFSLQERVVFSSLSLEQRQLAFFTAWTGKEAYLKAIGSGLTIPLSQIEVSLHPELPLKLLSVAGDSTNASCWLLQSFQPTSDYQAAIAIQGNHWKMRWWIVH
jgi:4'-phosphopantetheinyl transferase